MQATGARTTRVRRDALVVGAILLVALALRVAIVLATTHSYKPQTDGADYYRIASSLAGGHGYGNAVVPPAHGASAFRTPLLPFLLAALFKVTGPTMTGGRLLNAVVGTVAVATIGLLARELFGRRVALIALAMAAVYPPLLLAGYGLQYEAAYVALVCGTLTVALRYRTDPRVRWLLAAGALTGLAVLCRESAALLLVAVAVLIWPVRAPALGHAARIAVVVACCVVVVLPWTARNAVRLHAFVPVSTSLGMGIQGSYNDRAAHNPEDLWVPSYADPATARLLTRRPMNEVQVDNLLRHATLRYIEDHPTYAAHVAFWNLVRLYDLRGGSDAHYTGRYMPWDQGLVSAAIITYFIVLALAVAGAFTRRVRTVPFGVWLVPILFTAALIVVAGNTRYRAPIEPFLLLLAASAVAAGIDSLRGRAAGDGHDGVAEGEGDAPQQMALARHGARQAPVDPSRDAV